MTIVGARGQRFQRPRLPPPVPPLALALDDFGAPVFPREPLRVRVENRVVLPAERLPMSSARLLRTFAFYALVFVPLAVAPVCALLAAAIHWQLRAGIFWPCALACLAWALAVVAGEPRLMGPPRGNG